MQVRGHFPHPIISPIPVRISIAAISQISSRFPARLCELLHQQTVQAHRVFLLADVGVLPGVLPFVFEADDVPARDGETALCDNA